MHLRSSIARSLTAASLVILGLSVACQDNTFTGSADKKAATAKPATPTPTPSPTDGPALKEDPSSPKDDPKVGDTSDCTGLSASACHKQKADDGNTGSYRVVVCSDEKSDQCAGRVNQAKDQDGKEGSKIVVVSCDPKDQDAAKAAACAATVKGKLGDLTDAANGTDTGKLGDSTDTATDGAQLDTEEGKVCKSNSSGYGGKVYRLPPGTDALPDLKAMTPIGQTDAPTLDVPPRSWTAGFPGVPDLIEWFAIRFYASLDVPAAGSYAFATMSDDGSKVFIDGAQVIANDGIHGPTRRESSGHTLTKGRHKLVVEWFQGPRVKIALRVFWKRPGSDWEIIPAQFLNHDKLCDLTELGTFN